MSSADNLISSLNNAFQLMTSADREALAHQILAMNEDGDSVDASSLSEGTGKATAVVASPSEVEENERRMNESDTIGIYVFANQIAPRNTLNLDSRRITTVEVLMGSVADPNYENRPRRQVERLRLYAGMNFTVNRFLFEKAKQQHPFLKDYQQQGILKVLEPVNRDRGQGLAGYGEEDARWIIEQTNDIGLLERWKSQTVTAVMQSALEERLQLFREGL